MSASLHSQTEGTSEVRKKMRKNYLRRYCSYRQDDWDLLLPLLSSPITRLFPKI